MVVTVVVSCYGGIVKKTDVFLDYTNLRFPTMLFLWDFLSGRWQRRPIRSTTYMQIAIINDSYEITSFSTKQVQCYFCSHCFKVSVVQKVVEEEDKEENCNSTYNELECVSSSLPLSGKMPDFVSEQ